MALSPSHDYMASSVRRAASTLKVISTDRSDAGNMIILSFIDTAVLKIRVNQ